MAHPDFEPHSVIRVISRGKPNDKSKKKDEAIVVTDAQGCKEISKEPKANVNEMGIQMISKNLFEQIFRNTKTGPADPGKVSM